MGHIKKITIIIISFALVFSVFAFSACINLNTGADEPCPTIELLRRIEELEYKLAMQGDRIAELERENQTLRDRVEELERELLRAKYDDFKLTISIEDAVWRRGEDNYLEDFLVSVELENISDKDFEISAWACWIFLPRIPDEFWIIDPRLLPSPDLFKTFKSGDTIQRAILLNRFYELPQGIYKLHFDALFYLNWEEGIPWKEKLPMTVTSNTVTITVK